jgi:hypothetical protein
VAQQSSTPSLTQNLEPPAKSLAPPGGILHLRGRRDTIRHWRDKARQARQHSHTVSCTYFADETTFTYFLYSFLKNVASVDAPNWRHILGTLWRGVGSPAL